MLVIVGVHTHHRWKRLDCFLFLASDAVKATAEGGRFQVRCSLSPPSEKKSNSYSDCREGGSTCSLGMLEKGIMNNLGEQSSTVQAGIPWLRASHTKKKKQTNCWFLQCLIKYVSTASATSNWKCELQIRGPLSSLSVGKELKEGFYLLWSQKACNWVDKDVRVVQSPHQCCVF